MAGSTDGRVAAFFAPLALAVIAVFLFVATSASAATPTVSVENAANVKFTSAEVNGSVDPGEEPTTYRFQYATQADFSDAVDGIVEGIEGTGPQPVGGELTNLAPNTTYHLRLYAENASGTDEAVAAETFTTKEVQPPEPTIDPASTLTYHSAHLSGTVALADEDPAFNTSSCAFQYITEEAFQANLAAEPPLDGFTGAASQPCEPETVLGTEAQPVEVNADLAGLAPGTTYHLRLVASNLGANATAVAPTFATEAVASPTATGLTVSALTATSAHFSATVNAGGSGPGEQTAVYIFSCSPECPGLPGPKPIVADGADHTVEATATGLEPNTPYTVTITATSPGGSQSAEAPFTTQTLAPEVVTLPFVGPASSEAARLYGTVNPHNSLTTYFFEYGPSAAYGKSAPASEDAAVPTANSPQTVSQELTGLAPSTEYHYRIVAHSPAGTVKGADRILTTAAAPQVCSAAEQQLRIETNSTELPDCRAYEMVTPPFKAGNSDTPLAISPDGSSVITESIGNFAGTEGSSKGADYLSVRLGSGWETKSIAPPSSSFPAQVFLDASADLTGSLWFARHPSQSATAQDFYLRKPDGSFVEVGPLSPPADTEGLPAGEFQLFNKDSDYNYKGASADLSHIVYDIGSRGFLWPGDTTQKGEEATNESLYEYVGTGNTHPELVGVSDGATVVNGETLPDGTLISDCATNLGSIALEGSMYNAISADGESVFFIAAAENSHACNNNGKGPRVDELYARIGGTKTVAISEPSAADCATCQTEEAYRGSAIFQGASRDGSKVFFLSEGKLFPGDSGMNLYEYDFANSAGEKIVPISTSTGVAEPLVQGVARVSEDGSHVYFVAQGDLTAGPNAEGNSPTEGADNLYVFERDAAHLGGRLAFVASLSPGDSQTFGGDWSVRDRRPVQASADGRFLIFQSAANLTPGDTSAVPQIFEYDAATEELIRISVAEAGYAAGSASADIHPSAIQAPGYVRFTPADAPREVDLSEDGSTVLFESAAYLTPGALVASEAGATSVYEYRSAGPLSNGGVHLLSDGNATSSSNPSGLYGSGGDAFFMTLEPLLASDGDTQPDLYDAHVKGGFPLSDKPLPCSGEACQGSPSGAPLPALPATPSFTGPSNPAPVHRRRRHRKKHHRAHQRAAHNNLGGRR